MADDTPHIARIEERVEGLGKLLARLELSIERQFYTIEKSVRDTINGRIAVVEAKIEALEARHTLVKVIVFSFVGHVLLAFLNSLIGERIGSIPTRMIPVYPPNHSSQERWQK